LTERTAVGFLVFLIGPACNFFVISNGSFLTCSIASTSPVTGQEVF
jgi:hypothetical protein